MATPTVWLNAFQVNTGTAATGSQSEPKIIGLNNGHFVVAWQENAAGQDAPAGAVATARGTDIVAKIFDAEGNVVRDSFQLNSDRNFDDELDFDLTATHDGFAMTYIDDSISNVNQTTVYYERFEFDGDRQTGTGTSFQIDNENVAADFLRNPQIAANLIASNDDIYVAYDDDVGTNTNINARIIDEANVLSAEFGSAQNSIDFDRLGDVTVLSNGNFVTAYLEDDNGTTSLEFVIRDQTGADVGPARALASEGDEVDIAALEGGGFVAVYTLNSDVLVRTFDNTGTLQVGPLAVASGTNIQNEPVVVGLSDGGFVVAWDDDTTGNLFARRYEADGTTDGTTFTVENTGTTQIDIGTTGDGRILFSWLAQGGEIFASVWDPRPSVIDPDDFDGQRAHVLDSDVITTGIGGSTVLAGVGSKTVFGQGGDDIINASSGGGEYFGGGGNDIIFASNTAFETLDGGTGIDTLNTTLFNGTYEINLVTGVTNFAPESFVNFENVVTGNGNTTITGTVGANVITTGSGNDTVNAGAGNDTINTGAGNDTVEASSGSDTIFLGDGNDTATSSGTDTIFGEAGDDLIFAGLGLPETLDGGTGVDTLNTTLFNGSYVVNLATGLTNFAGEVFTNFENIISGSGNDELFGTSGANEMDGGAGNDRILGLGGNDELIGGLGSDILNGGDGNDEIDGGDGNDIMYGGTGNDDMEGGDGDDLLIGNDGNDMMEGGLGNDVFRGGTGVDIIDGDEGDDEAFGGDGNDVLRGGDGNDLMDGSAGDDSIQGGDGNDILVGQIGNDILQGDSGADELRGGGGDDLLNGGTGNDTLFGGANEDTLLGGSGDDFLQGNQQDDELFGQSGNDRLFGGDGFDFLNGGIGDDRLEGNNGRDTLVGGTGADILIGGALGDTFVFSSVADSNLASRDTIVGIDGIGVANGDIIDVSAIDADTTVGGNQAFTFLGLQTTASALSFGAGALWVENAGGPTLLFGNIDNDATIEFAVQINDGAGVSAADYTFGDFIV
ncbi:calcium-binding protein [Roseobacter litoralis]|uniref:calcium-binding protein n=1 Tax=Roseobacter litoralis TaxID=42443 RepID=UPI002493A992|nr:calcium-binding protein [Roseobacter litoralis]